MNGLPTPPGAPTPANPAAPTAVSADQAAEDNEAKKEIKQFGPSEDADGNTIATPTVQGVDATKILVGVYAGIVSELAKLGVTDVQGFLEEAEKVDKTQYPGNKHGRVSYSTLNLIGRLVATHDLFTKRRGATASSAKAKLEEKDNKIAGLEAKLAELMAQMASLTGAK